MRIRLTGLLRSAALLSAVASSGCGKPSSPDGGTGGMTGSGGTAGTPGSGGTGGSSATQTCPGVTPCGGSVVGTWSVASSCLTLAGDMDVALASLGCSKVPVTGSLHVTGTWSANDDGTYSDNTVTTGNITFPLAPACLSVSSVQVECAKVAGTIEALGWTNTTCSNDAAGKCSCSATPAQHGGIGVISPWAMPNGTYTTSGTGLNTDGMVDYSYCTSASTVTLTPKATNLPISGTIVLQKSSNGTGGASGAAGATGSGGITGSGGAGNAGMGGATGSPGGFGAGGNTASGGHAGTGTGAVAGSGGRGGAGGSAGTGAFAGGNKLTLSNRYGMPLSFQNARTIRVSVRFTF